MSDFEKWMIFLFLVVPVWSFIGSVVGSRFLAWRLSVCDDCMKIAAGQKIYWNDGDEKKGCDSDHVSASVIAGLFWFVTVPAVGGHLIGRNTQQYRAQKQTLRELADAKRDAEIARIRRQEAEETIRELEAVRRDDELSRS